MGTCLEGGWGFRPRLPRLHVGPFPALLSLNVFYHISYEHSGALTLGLKKPCLSSLSLLPPGHHVHTGCHFVRQREEFLSAGSLPQMPIMARAGPGYS